MQAQFTERFAALSGRLPGEAHARMAAAGAFARLGLPGPRDEAWKYTNLRMLAQTAFAEQVLPVAGRPSALDRAMLLDAPVLIYVDGFTRADLSTAESENFAVHPEFGTLARPDRDALAALNTMLCEDGARVMVAAGQDCGLLQLVSVATGVHDRPVAFHPRHRIELGAGARLTLIETALGDGVYLHNPVSEIVLGEGAVLTHLRVQDESADAFHTATIYADVAARGRYESFLLNMGGRLSRNEVHARISGDCGIVHLNCAQILRGVQHGDFTTVLSHDAPGGQSRQTVRNALDGEARGVFQGRIEVARAAQKTDGYQMNHTLLLSGDAEIDSKPELRINADDVKCSHGATVGELDTDQLFYLRSRGIDADLARAMLIRGFLSESLAEIVDPAAREMFETLVDRWWERGRV